MGSPNHETIGQVTHFNDRSVACVWLGRVGRVHKGTVSLLDYNIPSNRQAGVIKEAVDASNQKTCPQLRSLTEGIFLLLTSERVCGFLI